MNIIIYRRRFSRWGVDGTLVIKGVKVCNTLEHPERLLPAGEYKIALLSVVMNKDKKKSGKKSQLSKKMPIILKKGSHIPTDVSRFPYLMPGNGPLTLKKGCIILGKAVATGLVIHSREHFDRLYERLKKGVKTYEGVSLTIIDLGTDEIPTEI